MSKQIPTTGSNPHRANARRRHERQLDQACLRVRIISSKGRIPRKRKKHIHLVERGHYRALIAMVAKDLEKNARRRATAAQADR